MTLELVIFVVVAAVAIFSAAFMLASRNAVHSALFLVTNFLCVAFFYLMLSAPFLAMIQVTVYAGAIMVLFMFVIMLLGAEKLGTEQSRYPWIMPAAVILTTIFLIAAYAAIRQGNFDLLKPIPPQPNIRVVNTAAGAPAVDVYLNENKVAANVSYRGASQFTPFRAGDYNLLVFPACTEADLTRCTDPIKSNAAPVMAVPVKLESATTTTFVVAGAPDQLHLITVPTDLTTLENEETARLTAVNALPGSGTLNLAKVNQAAPTQTDVVVGDVGAIDSKDAPASKMVIVPPGSYNLVWERKNGDTVDRIVSIPGFTMKPKTHEMLILAPETIPGQQGTRPTIIRLEPPTRTLEAYGSPQQIGQTMLSTFLLPFELVSLLLLAAMVGAIILTREEVVRRVRQRLVVSPVVRRINRGAASRPNPETEPSAD